MQDVEGVGQEGDVLRVRHGFARNILIPSKKAVPGTAKNIELYGQRVLVWHSPWGATPCPFLSC